MSSEKITVEQIERMEKMGTFNYIPAFGQWSCNVCASVVVDIEKHFSAMHHYEYNVLKGRI
jgi:hypothetical protein